jgi:hypothetical protein
MALPAEAIVGIIGVVVAIPPMIYAVEQMLARSFDDVPGVDDVPGEG